METKARIRMNEMTAESTMEICFWGTRGTLPAPGRQFSRAGGNTNCTEVTIGNHTIVFDAGTGIRELGSTLATLGHERQVSLMLTHAHYDHVEGIPFFAPFFIEGKKIGVHCGKLDGSNGTEDTVLNLMRRPYFPVGPSVFMADVSYETLEENAKFELSDGISVTTTPLNHPGGATAYRLDVGGKSFACVTDTEHVSGTRDENILRLIDGVDAFIYDASLTDDEYPDFAGYGHSTYEEGMRLQKEAGAGALIAFHHMPFRVDDELDHIEKGLKEQDERNMIAREGFRFQI